MVFRRKKWHNLSFSLAECPSAFMLPEEPLIASQTHSHATCLCTTLLSASSLGSWPRGLHHVHLSLPRAACNFPEMQKVSSLFDFYEISQEQGRADTKVRL